MNAPEPTPEDLFHAAQLGRKLKPRERSSVVLWLERTGKILDYADGQLKRILGVKNAVYARLRRQAQATIAQAISPEEATNYVAEYLRTTDFLMAQAKDGVMNAPANSGAHQGYMRLLKELSGEKIDKLQSIGVVPKELGRLTTIEEEWVATVSDEGVASVKEAERHEPV